MAEVAGSDWPARARAACLALTGRVDPDEGGASERLLDDLHAIFYPEDGAPVSELITAVVIERLKAIEDAPWDDWAGGRGLSSRGLAQLLRPYGIRPKKWGGGQRGYRRADLEDAWTRYRRAPAQSATPAIDRQQSTAGAGKSAVADGVADANRESATSEDPGTARAKPSAVADVAGRADERVGEAPSSQGPTCLACLSDEGNSSNGLCADCEAVTHAGSVMVEEP